MTTTQKSTAFSSHSPVAAIASVDDLFKTELIWLPQTDNKERVDTRQQSFLENFYNSCKADYKTLPEVMGKASRDYLELNAYLKEKKSKLQFPQPFESGKFGAVGIVRIGGQWTAPGKPLGVFDKEANTTRPAFKLANGDEVPGVVMRHSGPARTFEVDSSDDSFVSRIPMINGTTVSMTKCKKAPARTEDLVLMASDFSKRCNSQSCVSRDSKGGIKFPMVDLDVEVDLSWMVGMYSPLGGDKISLEEAIMVASVQMNHLGAVAKVDTRATFGITCVREETTIWHELDDNFLLWFEKPGAQQPVVAVAYVTRESFKDPGNIDFSVVPTTKEA